MQLVKTISTELDNLSRRVVKFLRFGKSDVQTSLNIAPYGIDSNPIKNMVAVYSETNDKGKTVILGYVNKDLLAEPGEVRMFSTDVSGELQGYVWVKKDGKVFLNGDTFGSIIKIDELKSQWDSNFRGVNTAVASALAVIDAQLIALGQAGGSATNLDSIYTTVVNNFDKNSAGNAKVKHG